MKSRTCSWLSVSLVLLMTAACGGHHKTTPDTTTYLRLVNTTDDAALSLSASGTVEASNIGIAGAGGYASLTTATYTLVASAADGMLAASSSQSDALAADTHYSVVAYQRNGAVNILTLTDNLPTPSAGFAQLDIANPAPDAGPLDVYLVPPGSSIASYSPNFSDVVPGSNSLSQSINAGSYDIIVTAYNKPSDVRLTLHSVTLASTEIGTLLLTSTVGGALVDGALVQQGGAVQLVQRSDSARVRVVSALPAAGSSNPTVSIALANNQPLSTFASPSIGTYALVPAAAMLGSINVTSAGNTTAVASLPTAAFVSGGDYTVLVYGSAATPTAAVLIDNNQAPASSSAKMRLVNAVVPSASGGTSLSNNFVTLVSELNYGTASVYSGISTGTSALTVSSPQVSFPTYNVKDSSGNNPVILSGGVYSIFVLGDTSTPIVALTKDR